MLQLLYIRGLYKMMPLYARNVIFENIAAQGIRWRIWPRKADAKTNAQYRPLTEYIYILCIHTYIQISWQCGRIKPAGIAIASLRNATSNFPSIRTFGLFCESWWCYWFGHREGMNFTLLMSLHPPPKVTWELHESSMSTFQSVSRKCFNCTSEHDTASMKMPEQPRLVWSSRISWLISVFF